MVVEIGLMPSDLKTDEIEEDWTSIMETTTRCTSEMDVMKFRLSNSTMSLYCIESLTPLDMMHLSEGKSDMTGSKIWMAAHLFLAAFSVHPVQFIPLPRSELEFRRKHASLCDFTVEDMDKFIVDLRLKAFRNKNVIELGCGTGISGISLMLQPKCCRPSFLTFTDMNLATLELCRKNCTLNIEETLEGSEEDEATLNVYGITPLSWTSTDLSFDDNPLLLSKSYDTVIATDVLYDLSTLEPLLHTAFYLLKSGGFFILSHVPRSNVESDAAVIGRSSDLEKIIVQEAEKIGFNVSNTVIIRPFDLQVAYGKVNSYYGTSVEELNAVGSAILVFQASA